MINCQIPEELFNPRFLKYLTEVESTVEILFGGAGSSKTVHSAFKDIIRVLHGKNVVVVRQVYNTLEDSYYQDLKKAVSTLGFDDYFKFKRSPLRIDCDNNKVILFRGLDDVEKIKGITVPEGQIDHFTIEEATEVSEFSVNQLQFRSRGGGSRMSEEDIELIKKEFDRAESLEHMTSHGFKKDIYQMLGFEDREDFIESNKTMSLLFNPIDKEHWICKRFFQDSEGNSIFEIEDKEYHTPELYIMHSDHYDNLFLTYDDHMRYEQYKYIDPYYHDVYARGKWGVLGDHILPNFKLANMTDEFINGLAGRVGMDFGDVDPTTMVRSAINKRKREIYILDEYGKSDNTTDGMIAIARSFLWHPDEIVRCDSAQPITIKDLNLAGIKAVGAHKSAGYKLQFYRYLRSFTIYINAKKCPNFAREIRSFTWKVDKKTGQKIEEIPDGNDHYLDAGLMYALNQELWSEMPNSVYGG